MFKLFVWCKQYGVAKVKINNIIVLQTEFLFSRLVLIKMYEIQMHSIITVVKLPGDMHDRVMMLPCWKEKVEMMMARKACYTKVTMTTNPTNWSREWKWRGREHCLENFSWSCYWSECRNFYLFQNNIVLFVFPFLYGSNALIQTIFPQFFKHM